MQIKLIKVNQYSIYLKVEFHPRHHKCHFRCSTPANSRDRPVYHSSYTRWSTSKLNYIAGKESSFTTPGTSPAHSSYSIKSLASSTNGSYNTYRFVVIKVLKAFIFIYPESGTKHFQFSDNRTWAGGHRSNWRAQAAQTWSVIPHKDWPVHQSDPAAQTLQPRDEKLSKFLTTVTSIERRGKNLLPNMIILLYMRV